MGHQKQMKEIIQPKSILVNKWVHYAWLPGGGIPSKRPPQARWWFRSDISLEFRTLFECSWPVKVSPLSSSCYNYVNSGSPWKPWHFQELIETYTFSLLPEPCKFHLLSEILMTYPSSCWKEVFNLEDITTQHPVTNLNRKINGKMLSILFVHMQYYITLSPSAKRFLGVHRSKNDQILGQHLFCCISHSATQCQGWIIK